MLKTLKTLLGLATREDAGTDELAPSLPAAETELAAARKAQEAAEQAYRVSLLAGNEADTLRLDTGRREASVRVDRAMALIEALGERLAEAKDREAEVARVERYEAAKRAAAEGREALALYPQVAEDLLSILRMVAEAEIAVASANSDLPRGGERLPGVEASVRDAPGEPEEIVSATEVQRWVEVGRTEPGGFDQTWVRETGHRRGVIPIRGLPLGEGRQVELRTFVERRFRSATSGRTARKLIEEVALPGFRAGEPDFARPIERPWQGALLPADVIGHLQALREKRNSAAEKQDHPAPERSIETRYVAEPGAKKVKYELTLSERLAGAAEAS